MNKSNNNYVLPVNIDTIEAFIEGGQFSTPNTDSVILYDHNGVQKMEYGNRMRIRGKLGVHSMNVRSLNSKNRFFFEGAIYACKYGQNTFTNSDLLTASRIAINKASKKCSFEVDSQLFEKFLEGDVELKRIDLAVNYRLNSKTEVQMVLKQIQRQLIEQHGAMRTNDSSACWAPKNGTEYSIVLYNKGDQMRHSMRGERNKPYYWDDLEKECETILRIEARLRKSALSKHGVLKVRDWKEGTADMLFRKYTSNLKLLNVTFGKVTDDELQAVPQRMRPVLALHKLGGNLDQIYTPRTCQRHRDFFRRSGIDLRCPNQKEGTITSLSEYLSPEKAIVEAPEWMIEKGLAPRRLSVSSDIKNNQKTSKLVNGRKRLMLGTRANGKSARMF